MATTQAPEILKKILRFTNIATWNTQGKLSEQIQREILLKDMNRYNVHIGCFQETRCEENYYQTEEGTLMTMPYDTNTPPQLQYGLGFYISPKLRNYFYGTKHISNRIAVIQFRIPLKQGKKIQLTIINVYAPTSQRVRANEQEAIDFYDQLQHTYNLYKGKSHYVIIAGDLNSKLGAKLTNEEEFIGSYGKGTRNNNGHKLADFLQINHLYATNTTFKQPYRHRTTWSMKIGEAMRYNQIDYIIIQQARLRKDHRGLLLKSRSYSGTSFESDHRLVITKFNLRAVYNKHSQTTTTQHLTFDRTMLSSSPTTQEHYQTVIGEELIKLTDEDKSNPQKYYDALIKIISNGPGIPRIIPTLRQTSRIKNFIGDNFLKEWTEKRRNIRTRLRGHPSKRKRKKLTKIRNNLSRQIRERIRFLHEQAANKIADHLQQYKGNRRCFEAVYLMKKIDHKPLRIQDQDGHFMYNKNLQLPIIKEHYKKFFNQEGRDTPIEPWEGNPRPLEHPITEEEVANATQKLNNGRAYGLDGTPGELYRYGGPELNKHLATIYNQMFENHQSVDNIGEGVLVTLNKMNGKAETINNTRPITLLNMIRKILSNIVLTRIQDVIFNFISPSQSAFRAKRSTADVIWSYRWIMAQTQKYEAELFIMGIDLSKAFDCIDRQILMSKLEEILQQKPSELRMIRYLLSNTNLTARVQGKLGDAFKTTLGIPQGDGLSPALFLIYLQIAIDHHQRIQREVDNTINKLTKYTNYADDTDFISSHYHALYSLGLQLPERLAIYNLQMNPDKTEWITINKSTCSTLTTKKLGSKLSQYEDLKHRIAQSRKAFSTMYRIWLNKGPITKQTKIYLYKMFVTSTLLYNTSCLGMSDKQLKPFDSTHRKQLRTIMNIRYPITMTNTVLYKNSKSRPIHIEISKQRWKLLGHILRLEEEVPAHSNMVNYYTNPDRLQKQRERTTNNLPTILHQDLETIGMKLLHIDDLSTLREIAQDRKAWQRLYGNIIRKKITKAKKGLLEQERCSRRLRNDKRERERRVELPDGINDETGQKRRRLILTAYTPPILRINLKRRRQDLPDTNADLRTPPNLRINERSPAPAEDFADRFLTTNYNFM